MKIMKIMKIPHSLLLQAAALSLLLLPGCMAPGYPYPGTTPTGVAAPPPGSVVAPAPAPAIVTPVSVLPYAYTPPQIIVTPAFYAGWGWGYWYGNRFWTYRPNCGFWRGRYYNGYRWNGYRPTIHGGYYGGYRGQGGWYR